MVVFFIETGLHYAFLVKLTKWQEFFRECLLGAVVVVALVRAEYLKVLLAIYLCHLGLTIFRIIGAKISQTKSEDLPDSA